LPPFSSGRRGAGGWPDLFEFGPDEGRILAEEDEVDLKRMALGPQLLVLLYKFLVLGRVVESLEVMR
jgi:hypothetical protein